MKTYVFIDASNLFYGGVKSLGWKIDYRKLFEYLKKKYGISKTFYFGGVETYNYKHDYLKENSINVEKLRKYLRKLLKNEGKKFSEAQLILFDRHLRKVKFYSKLQEFGHKLLLLARGKRTAKEIRQFAGSNFKDFEYLKYIVGMREK